MKIVLSKLYDNSDSYFELDGSAVMKLTASAAKDVCNRAVDYAFLIERVEGGIKHDSGFEARIDCIWDSPPELRNKTCALENNRSAYLFISENELLHNAFILTTIAL